MIFEVWAPCAKSIELVLACGAKPMQSDERGWWRLETDAPAGTRYQFRVDGNGPFPDPRSPWQPDGVHGPSMTIDHDQFRWRDEDFRPVALDQAVIYELHIGTFTPEGTYAAAIERLGHLRDLGVTHVELMPLATFPGRWGWGYDGVALYAPHPEFGSPDDLKAFVQAAHDEGIAVLLDVVYNHFGPDGNYLGVFGPYFTDHVKTPWGDAVNFDRAFSDEVRAFFIDNALMWLRDYHFDGLRLDAVHAIFDERATHFLEELAIRVGEFSAATRPRILIAESDLNNPRLVWPREQGGYGLDAHWEDDFHHALHVCLTGERDGFYADFNVPGTLAKALEQGYVFEGQFSAFRQRGHGRPPANVRPGQLVICVQNHDQIGNRARGERLSHLVDARRLKLASALLLLSPFVPMLFQGEEWGASTPFQYFTDHHEELGRLVTEGRHREFAAFAWLAHEVPDPQARATFERSKLRWEERDEEFHRDILEWHRALIALRTRIPAGTPAEVEHDEASGWLCVRRGEVEIMANLGTVPQAIPVPCDGWQTLLSSEGSAPGAMLPPGGACVVRVG